VTERLLFKPEEAAERLGIGRSTLFELIRDQKIKSVKIGRSRRIPTEAITEYAASLVRAAGDAA
jgi:excisionase family DNA binding protein